MPEFSHHNSCPKELGCSWYHGNWRVLKSLGIVSTSAIHQEELIELIVEAVHGLPSPRVLISGSTDEELLRIVCLAFARHQVNPLIEVVDICPTPLGWMNEYAALKGLTVTTHCANILDLGISNRYDLIVTHAFLGYFSPQARPDVIRRWAGMLRDRGKVITVQRIREGESRAKVSFEHNESVQFVARAVTAATASQAFNVTPKQAKLAAEAFTKNFSIHPINSEKDFQSLFCDHGFKLKRYFSSGYPSQAKLSGPSVPSGGKYAFVIAEKLEQEYA